MFILFYSVIGQLHKQPNWKDSIHGMFLAATGQQRWKLYCMFLLMPVNWTLETAKWQIALRPIQSIKFLRAFKAILAGTCIASFTPNRVGEYLGRMLFVDPGNKVVSVAPTILCSMSQMLITLMAGSAGLLLYKNISFVQSQGWMTPFIFRVTFTLTILVAIALILIYYRFDPLVRRVNKWLIRNKRRYSVPENYSSRALSAISVSFHHTVPGISSAVRAFIFFIRHPVDCITGIHGR